MTEKEWLVSENPTAMAKFVCSVHPKWERKLRLFCLHMCRYKSWFDEVKVTTKRDTKLDLNDLLIDAEKWIDGLGPNPNYGPPIVCGLHWILADEIYSNAQLWCRNFGSRTDMPQKEKADLLRHLIGNPFRKIT